MANDNHEVYGGLNISTYSDDITTQNRFTEDEINACVLSAGACTWFNNTASVITGRYSHESATGGANSNVPFYKESDSQILWYDESALAPLPDTNLYRYRHCVYISTSGNKLASSLKIENYKNVLTIITRQESDIQGEPVIYYYPRITTQYGSGENWTNSVLMPAFLFKNTNNIVGAQNIAVTTSVSRWWWGGENDTGNDLWADPGAVLFDRNLQYGTDMGGHEYIPWELCGTDPIRISEGGATPTFPCRFDNNHLTWGFYGNNPLRLFIGINNVDDCLLLAAFCGLKFEYNGVLYKPIVENGVVTGYTSDMTRTSEWDAWRDIGDHSIPVVPPSPPAPTPTDEDNQDPISTTGAPFSSGIAHYYVTTAGSLVLSHISTALGSWNISDTGKDLFKNLISCKLIKPPTAIPSSSSTFTIYGVQPEYEGSPITISEITGNSDITFGPYRIPRKYNDFRDYSPYSRAEIFLPYCGWCGLPSHVIGRSVSVRYFTDLIAATCKAIVFCENNIVAEASGIIGVDIPMSADAVGMKMAGAASGLLAIVSGGVQAGAGAFAAMTGNPGKGITTALSGLAKVAAGYTQSAMALNENTTEISGKNTDGCCIAGTTRIIIKITRPKTGGYNTAPYVSAGYAHNIGYVSNKSITVNQASGLLICDNADTSGISGATDAERAEIKRVLETGIYVNSPPE